MTDCWDKVAFKADDDDFLLLSLSGIDELDIVSSRELPSVSDAYSRQRKTIYTNSFTHLEKQTCIMNTT